MMPFIVKWPGVTKFGSRDNHLIQNIDYAPTFLEMAGAPVPNDMQGRSLLPLLKGKSPDNWRDSIYYHYYEYPSVHMIPRHYGIRTQRYKLMHFYQFGDEWELYDRLNDPNEMNNVYNDPAYADVVKELKVKLADLRVKYKDSEELDQKFIY